LSSISAAEEISINKEVAAQPGDEASWISEGQHDPASGSYFSPGVELVDVGLYCDNEITSCVTSGQLITVRVKALFKQRYADPHLGFQIRNARGEPVYMTTTNGLGHRFGAVEKGHCAEAYFSFKATLAEGDYTITAGVANKAMMTGQFAESLTRLQNAYAFSLIKSPEGRMWAGMFDLAPTCKVEVQR
jgi:lipopolysaccharide transport system ATP-binding protein